MIPIRFKSTSSKRKLYHSLLNVKTRQNNKSQYIVYLKKINKWCMSNIHVNGKKYSFPEIIKADYDELIKIKNILDSGKKLPTDFENFIERLYKNRFPRERFVEELQVTVCPYCNRNFINSTNRRTLCDLDHFFSKSSYPLLAVSFHNLVPVCHACNHAKGSKYIKYSPHDKYMTDDLLQFDFYFRGLDILFDESQIGIEIKIKNKNIFNDNVEVLKLKEVYQIHTDVVQELLKKSIIFNSQYLEDLYNIYENLFDSKEELYRIVYGNYLEETNYEKRPLSKFTKDIFENLK